MITKKISILLIFLLALSAKGQQERYVIENLNINDNFSNFGTTFYGEDQVVYASPKKNTFIIKSVWKGNNQPFLDLFIGKIKEDGQLEDVKKFSRKLNTRFHEADVAFTKDKKTVYFSRNNYYDKKLTRDSTGTGLIQLYRARITKSGKWVDVEPMPFNNDQFQTGHPTLSADERTLYFISDMPGGLGKTDIYKASISENGSIGQPINMGPKINTPEREMFSSISGNDELYFSSDGRADGLGELDIYVSKITERGLTEPQNLGIPVNSEKDDFAFILNYNSRRGYFSSNREGGQGDDDIYTFVQNIPIEFKCDQGVKGVVTDTKTGELVPEALVVLYDDSNTEIKRTIVGQDAAYNFEVECNKNFKIIASKENYTEDSKEFYSIEGEDLDIPLSITTLEALYDDNGKCVVRINPIYFDFDKSDIRADAAIELDKVVNAMNDYPEVIIEGGSHTDSRGSFAYNVELSSRRAKSTVDYIISKGIDPKRITSKGYGESELINNCSNNVDCTEAEHQFNRRTEFVVVNAKEMKEKYPDICAIETISTKEQIEKRKELIENRDEASFDTDFEIRGDQVLIRISPIYFDLNSSKIRSDAVKELKKVIEVMSIYPNIVIEGGSHTDSRASYQYNMNLSRSRAEASVDYITSKGIDPSRISARGFGESSLINHCSNGVKCSNLEHQQNRRTEFVIVNPQVILQKKE